MRRIVTIGAMLCIGLTTLASANTIYDDFDDGNMDGWSLLLPTGTWSASFPPDPWGGKSLKLTGERTGGSSVYFLKDLFAFDTNPVTVQFDFYVTESGSHSPSGSSHVEPQQYYDNNNLASDTLRWGAYNDMYSRRWVGGNLSAGGNFPYPPSPFDRTRWTTYRVEWNDDLATVSYLNWGVAGSTWHQAYSYHNGNGSIPLGGVFRIGLGSVWSHCEFGLDNIITPEPATLSLLAFGGLGLLSRRRAVAAA